MHGGELVRGRLECIHPGRHWYLTVRDGDRREAGRERSSRRASAHHRHGRLPPAARERIDALLRRPGPTPSTYPTGIEWIPRRRSRTRAPLRPGRYGRARSAARTLGRAHAVHPTGALQPEYPPWGRGVEGEIRPTGNWVSAGRPTARPGGSRWSDRRAGARPRRRTPQPPAVPGRQLRPSPANPRGGASSGCPQGLPQLRGAKPGHRGAHPFSAERAAREGRDGFRLVKDL